MRLLRDQRYIDMLKFGQQKESHRVTLNGVNLNLTVYAIFMSLCHKLSHIEALNTA